LHRVHEALSLRGQTSEDLAWLGNYEEKCQRFEQGVAAAVELKEEVDSWDSTLTELEERLEEAEVLLGLDDDEEEEGNDGEDN
jgi:hypothetical protein